MIPAALILEGVVAGVAELVKFGIVKAEEREQAVEIMVKAMKPTPSSKEIDDYRAAEGELEALIDSPPLTIEDPKKPRP